MQKHNGGSSRSAVARRFEFRPKRTCSFVYLPPSDLWSSPMNSFVRLALRRRQPIVEFPARCKRSATSAEVLQQLQLHSPQLQIHTSLRCTTDPATFIVTDRGSN